jgi:hypothetical protein
MGGAAMRTGGWAVCAACFAVFGLLVACGGKTIGDLPTPTTTTVGPPNIVDPVDPVDPDPNPPTIPTPKPKPPTKPLPPQKPDPDPDPDPDPPCQAQPFYLDADGDGFGDDKTVVVSCTAPKGYVQKGGDCFDKNIDAHPGQQLFFTKDRGDGSFDYDCDQASAIELKTQEPQYCLCSQFGCSTSGGWIKTVPSCGEAGEWNTSETQCQFTPEKRIQGCR